MRWGLLFIDLNDYKQVNDLYGHVAGDKVLVDFAKKLKASIRPGDLFASGTVSGATVGSLGSLLEMSWNGEREIALDDGTTRTFLENGDRVTLRGWCGGHGRPRIGFGECTGIVMPARV